MSPGLHTKVCDLFDIEIPLCAAGMADVTLAPLAGAVSRAGGLGVLGATFFTPDRLREQIREVRAITDRPFGVGLLFPKDIAGDVGDLDVPPFPDFLADLLPEVEGLEPAPMPPPLTQPLAEAQVAVALEERVPVIAAGLGTPPWLIERAHAQGTKVISLVASTRQGVRAAALGADCLVAQGAEAGGHTGSIGTCCLVPGLARAVSVPVLAAGGIVDGAGIAAALAAGAEGAWLGTRFLATPEATTHEAHKRAVVEADETATVVSRSYTGKPSRILRNLVHERWAGHESEILPMPWQAMRIGALVEPARAAGRTDLANYPIGQGSGLVDDIVPAGELVERLLAETLVALRRVDDLVRA